MSLYNRDNPEHEAMRTNRMAHWTADKEAAFQAELAAMRAAKAGSAKI